MRQSIKIICRPAMLHAFRFSGALQHGLCRQCTKLRYRGCWSGDGRSFGRDSSCASGSKTWRCGGVGLDRRQMAAAAVSTMDEGNNLTPPSGIYREFPYPDGILLSGS